MSSCCWCRSGSGGVGQLNKLPRLLRIFKLLRIFRLAKLLPRLEEIVTLNPTVLRLLKITASLFCFWHWLACIYFLLSDLEDFGYLQAFYARESGNSWVPPPYIWCIEIEQERCNESYWERYASDIGFNQFSGLDNCFASSRCPASYRLQYLHAFYWVSVTRIDEQKGC